MTRKRLRRDFVRRSALAVAAGLAGCLGSLGPSAEKQVYSHEEKLSRFRDVGTAIDEGYRTTATYVQSEEGVLGIPFINRNVEKLQPTKPQVVLYGLTEEGQYRPFGLKWFVPADDRNSPPTLFGKQFVGPIEGDSALVPKHYALYVWLFYENPDGLFATYNPAIQPPKLVDRIAPVREALRRYFLGREAQKRAGYKNTEQCIATADSGYGVPFVKKDAERGTLDPREPPILLYRVTANWSYNLMGAEWYVPVDEVNRPPSMFGQQFHDPMNGHSPKTDQPKHYGLHAWLFQANQRGMFAQFNPAIHC